MQDQPPFYAETKGLYGTVLDQNPDFVSLRTRLEAYLTDSKRPEAEQSCHKRNSQRWKLVLYSALTGFLQEIVFIRDRERQKEGVERVKKWYWNKVSALPPEVSPVRELKKSPNIHSTRLGKDETHAISLRRKLDSVPPIESLSVSPSKTRPSPILPPPSPINLSFLDGLTPSTLTTIHLTPDSVLELTELRRNKTATRVKLPQFDGEIPSNSPLTFPVGEESGSIGCLSRSFQRLSKAKIVTDRDLLDSCAFPRLNLRDSQVNWEVKMLEVRESKRKLAQLGTPCTYDRLKTALMKPSFLEDRFLTPGSLPQGGEWLTPNPFSKLVGKPLRKKK